MQTQYIVCLLLSVVLCAHPVYADEEAQEKGEEKTEEKGPWGQSGLSSPELGNLLRDIHVKYGPDTVSLLGSLLNATIYSGSVLTASVRVNDPEEREHKKFLVFRVETGIIFNTQTHNQSSRLTLLWAKILDKAFTQHDRLEVPADGVMIDMLYFQKSYPETDGIEKHVDEPGTVEEVKFYFPAEPLQAFLRKELPAPALLARSAIVVGNAAVTLVLPGHIEEEGAPTPGPTDKKLDSVKGPESPTLLHASAPQS
jgi:hypothetical protein